MYIARLASNEIFSPSKKKIHREEGPAKNLSAPLYSETSLSFKKTTWGCLQTDTRKASFGGVGMKESKGVWRSDRRELTVQLSAWSPPLAAPATPPRCCRSVPSEWQTFWNMVTVPAIRSREKFWGIYNFVSGISAATNHITLTSTLVL